MTNSFYFKQLKSLRIMLINYNLYDTFSQYAQSQLGDRKYQQQVILEQLELLQVLCKPHV